MSYTNQDLLDHTYDICTCILINDLHDFIDRFMYTVSSTRLSAYMYRSKVPLFHHKKYDSYLLLLDLVLVDFIDILSLDINEFIFAYTFPYASLKHKYNYICHLYCRISELYCDNVHACNAYINALNSIVNPR